jgi:hypothetical protein
MTKKTTRTRAEAKKLMWEYYKDNKESLPSSIRDSREEIIEYLLSGFSVFDAFNSITGFSDRIQLQRE